MENRVVLKAKKPSAKAVEKPMWKMPSYMTKVGVEIEVLTGHRNGYGQIEVFTEDGKLKFEDWKSCAEALKGEIEIRSVEIYIAEDHRIEGCNRRKVTYRQWSIQRDASILDDEANGRWGMELASPIIEFQLFENWHKDIEEVWEALTVPFQTYFSEDCGTQIHISPLIPGWHAKPITRVDQWSLNDIKRIAKTIIYYERTVDALVPQERRVNRYCLSNRFNIKLQGKSTREIFDSIDSAPDRTTIVQLMCSRQPRTVHVDVDAGTGGTCLDPNFRWNFLPLIRHIGTPAFKGSLEFRLPPQSTSARDTRAWMEFVVCFVQAAIARSGAASAAADDPSFPDPATVPDLEHLESHIAIGIRVSHIRDRSYLADLWKGKSMLPRDVTRLPEILGKDRPAWLEEAARGKGLGVGKFIELHGFR